MASMLHWKTEAISRAGTTANYTPPAIGNRTNGEGGCLNIPKTYLELRLEILYNSVKTMPLLPILR